MALGIGPGDEVITTSNTFFATAEAIWVAGATAVFVDIDPKTCNIDTNLIEAAITPKTKAIVPVHLYGQPAKMREVAAIAKKHKLFVVEDNAQALGARGDNFALGELSDAMCTSFIIQKNLGCFGDGGAVVTNDPKVATRIRQLRNHGSLKRSVHSMGYNSRLDDIHAAVLSVKLQATQQVERSAAGTRQGIRRRTGRHVAQAAHGAARLPAHLPSLHRGDETTATACKPISIRVASPPSRTIRSRSTSRKVIRGGTARGFAARSRTRSVPRRVCSRLPMFPEVTSEEVAYVIDAIRTWDRAHAGKG